MSRSLDVSAKFARVKTNDELFESLSIALEDIEKGISGNFPHWREPIFNFQVSQWIEALQMNNTIENVHIDKAVSIGSLWNERKTISFMKAIGSLPSLEKLEFREHIAPNIGVRNGSLKALTGAVKNARRLTSLKLETSSLADIDDVAITAFVGAIQGRKQLHCLKIDAQSWTENQVRAILPLLHNKSSITEIAIGHLSDVFLPLIDALALSKTVEKVTLLFLEGIDDLLCEKLAQALQANCSIKSLALVKTTRVEPYTSGISEKGYRCLAKMMEHNFHIQDLKTPGPGANADIEFYTKLNRAGRRKLFLNDGNAATQNDWIDVIVALQGDVEGVFHLLLLNPSLLSRQ